MFSLNILFARAFANVGPVLLTAQQLCSRLTISEATLRRYRQTQPDFPIAIKLGPRRIAFRADDVDQYVERRLVSQSASR